MVLLEGVGISSETAFFVSCNVFCLVSIPFVL